MKKLSQEEIQKAMRECVASSYTYDLVNPNGYFSRFIRCFK
ncbi:hypothetical protein [Campylobacter jejuni]|nr:hypothetical protein [Campylobacter jejuni]